MDKKKEKYIRKKAEPDEVESDLVSFDLVDAKTVKRRIEEGDVRTPFMRTKKYLDIPKDQRWNTKQLNSKLLAGILNGDSIPKIATSLQDVIGNNSAAATRNARTIITGAENAGRKDSYEDLEEQGVIQKKVWIATPDDRTRESHLLMDGEEVDIDERFSNGLMYPADPSGDASEVYNCRCTMRTHIIGFRKADGRIEKVGQRDDIGHEAAIAKEQAEREREAEEKLREKEAREAENEAKRRQEEERREEIDRQEEKKASKQKPEEKTETRPLVQGNDITNTWTRRPDQFEYEIEDIINAQGFDGLPKVVPAEDFDKAVKESNFIAQRVVRAPDEETMQAYTDQLYNGNWYVDCSTGGSSFGQGMYCVANYNGELTSEISKTMDFYAKAKGYGGRINENQIARIETFTLDPSAKILDYEKLEEMSEDPRFLQKFDLYKSQWEDAPAYIDNITSIAAALGYDAVHVNIPDVTDETIILNRTKVIFKENKKK